MRFEEIGETTTITFDMDGLHAMVLICQTSMDSGVEGVQHVEAFHAAFVAATLIARTHGDIGEQNRAHMAAIHGRIKAGTM